MLKDWIEFYTQKNLIITPVRKETKAPFLKDWNTERFDDQFLIDNYGDNGFALVTGAMSDIIALDLDLIDPRYQQVALKVLKNYPTPVKRQGNKDKLPTYFYRYIYHDFSKISIDKNNGIEVLSDGRCCVLPPSEHPNGYLFEWVGESLVEFNLDYLPEFNLNLFYELQKAFSGYSINTDSKDFGRHLKLVSIASAMIENQDRFDKIVNELLEYDKNQNNPPYLTDDSENHKHPPAAIASHIVASVLKTHCSKGKIYNPVDLHLEVKDIEEEHSKIEYQRTPLPHWKGIGDTIFKHIYESSPIPRSRFAWAATMATIGTNFSNLIRYENLCTNTYSMLITYSSGGKDIPLKAPTNIFSECERFDLIGDGKPRSSAAMIMDLENQRERIDTVDEMKDLLIGMTNSRSHLSGVAEMYSHLYFSTNSIFHGVKTKTDKNAKDQLSTGYSGRCFSPCVSFIGAITPEAFRNSFSQEYINEGLGSRFLYFWDEDVKEKNYRAKNIFDLPQDIKEFMGHWALVKEGREVNEESLNLNSVSRWNIPDIKASEKVKDALVELDKMYHHEFNEALKSGGYADPIKNRLIIFIKKIALINACSRQFMSKDASFIEMAMEDVDWANEAVLANYNESKYYLNLNVASNKLQKKQNKILEIIDKKNKAVTTTELYRSVRWSKKEMAEVIDSMLLSGLIREEMVKTKTKNIQQFLRV